MAFSPVPDLAIHITPDEDHHDQHQPSQDRVKEALPEPTPRARAQRTAHDKPRQDVARDELVSSLQPLDALPSHHLGRLAPVRLFEHLGEVRFRAVLFLVGLGEYRGREDRVYPHWGRLRVGRGVELHLLRQGVGEGAQGSLAGAIRRVSGDRVEGQEGREKDEMPRCRSLGRCVSILGRWLGRRLEPGPQGGVRRIDAREVIRIHLVLERGYVGVDKQRRVGGARTAPDYIWWRPRVPLRDLGQHAGTRVGAGHIGADVVKSLRLWRERSRADILDALLQPLRVPRDDDDAGALGSELAPGFEPRTSRASRDKDRLIR